MTSGRAVGEDIGDYIALRYTSCMAAARISPNSAPVAPMPFGDAQHSAIKPNVVSVPILLMLEQHSFIQ